MQLIEFELPENTIKVTVMQIISQQLHDCFNTNRKH